MYFTEEEWEEVAVRGLISGDHAAYVRAMAELLRMPHVGEAPHALDLVIGSFSKHLAFLPVLSLLRLTLGAGHSYSMSRVLEAFTPLKTGAGAAPAGADSTIHSFKELLSMVATRWGYSSRFFDRMSSGQNVAMLQELLIWLLSSVGATLADFPPAVGLSYSQTVALCRNVYEGLDYDAALVRARTQLAAALPLPSKKGKPRAAAAGVAAATAATDPKKAIAVKFALAQAEAAQMGEEILDSDDDGDAWNNAAAAPAAAAPAVSAAARKKQVLVSRIRALFTAFGNPCFLAVLRVGAIVTQPLRSAQVKAQIDQTVAPELVPSLMAAYSTVAALLKNEASYRAGIQKAMLPIEQSQTQPVAPFVPRVQVRETKKGSAAGTFVVTGKEDVKMCRYTVQLTAAEGAAAVEDVVEACRSAVLSLGAVWSKWVEPTLRFTERKGIAAGTLALPDEAECARHCAEPHALPRYLSTVNTDDDDTALTPQEQVAAAYREYYTAREAAVDGSAYHLTGAEQARPGLYWLRVRDGKLPGGRLTGEIMLWWLAASLTSCGLERGFSVVTHEQGNAQRRNMVPDTFAAVIMTEINRPWVEEQAVDAVTRFTAGM